MMKNIQVIDDGDNCTFSIFQATDEEFSFIFPELDQDIQFAEDLSSRAWDALINVWERPILKQDAQGIQGTLFYGFEAKRRHFPVTKREKDWRWQSLNHAQRRLYEQAPEPTG